MKTLNPFRNIVSAFSILGMLAFFTTGCDTGVDALGDEESVTVTGRVTDNGQQAGKVESTSLKEGSNGTLAGVEGAVVTAVAVNADGSVSPLEGEVQTEAGGTFTLEAEGEGAAGIIRVIASGENGFESSAIVNVDGRSSVASRPLNAESHAEASVFLEARAQGEAGNFGEGVTAADVSVFVNADAAAAINAGNQSASEVGMAITNAVKAKTEFNAQTGAGVDINALIEAKWEAYAQFQSDLHAASGAEAEAGIKAGFEDFYADIMTGIGVDVETQAEFKQTATAIIIEAGSGAGGSAELGLRKQAELIRGAATALAIEAIFQAEGASEANLEALAEARADLLAEIRAATSIETIVEAKSKYKSRVDAETESEFGISGEVRASAEAEVESRISILVNVITALPIFVEGVAEATAEAFADFYLHAKGNAQAVLESNGVNNTEAEAAAKVIVKISLMS